MRKFVGILLGTLLAISVVQSQTIDSGRVYMQLAGTALSKQDYRVAVDYYRSALRFRPDNAGATYNIACSYSLLNDKKEALKWLGKAIELGFYKFDDDKDFDSIRTTRKYVKLLAKATMLLEEVKGKILEPIIMLPDDFDSSGTYPLIIGLHGYGSNPVDFARALKNIPNRTGYILGCPFGQDVMGKVSFGWGERADAENHILSAIDYAKRKYRIDSTKIILLGFSQGGGVAYYMGLKRAELFRGIIPVAGGYDTTFNTHLANAKEKKLKFFVMLGEDEIERRINSNLEAVGQLIKSGITVSFNAYAGYGHTMPGDIDYEIERAILWLEQD